MSETPGQALSSALEPLASAVASGAEYPLEGGLLFGTLAPTGSNVALFFEEGLPPPN